MAIKRPEFGSIIKLNNINYDCVWPKEQQNFPENYIELDGDNLRSGLWMLSVVQEAYSPHSAEFHVPGMEFMFYIIPQIT